ncbi:MAG: MBL fold metallo-hydrolase [Micrococcales bacterium]|nr:MBL fold metallo-hydrolase [Micrococcales bacterium]
MRVHLLTCGHTTARAWLARRGAGFAEVRFPALVAVIEHERGVVVVDTGYAPRVVEAMRHGLDRLYGLALPVTVGPGEPLVDQLGTLGIAPGDVRTVVLTHLHADHLGGLVDLPDARVVTDARALAVARARRGLARARTGFVPALVPPSTDVVDVTSLPVVDEPRLATLGLGALGPTLSEPGPVRDLTGDGSVLVVPLPGHHDGHLGVLVRGGARDLLLVGDAVWDRRTVDDLRLPSRLVAMATHDWPRYVATVQALHRLTVADPDLLVVPSHDEQAISDARAVLG